MNSLRGMACKNGAVHDVKYLMSMSRTLLDLAQKLQKGFMRKYQKLAETYSECNKS